MFINTRESGSYPDDLCPLGARRVELADVPRVASAYAWGDGEPTVLALHGWGSDVRLLKGDLHNEAVLREGCAGTDVVYHVAGKIAARDMADFMATNRDGTANVLAAARDGGARRVLYVSSLAVAGPTEPGHPIDETRPPGPVTDYGRSKLAGEVLVQATSLPWTIVRPPLVYGEWDRGTLKIFQLAKTGILPVFGDGSQELSVIHAEDLARAIVAAATAPAKAGHVYFATHPTSTTSWLAASVASAEAPTGLRYPAGRRARYALVGGDHCTYCGAGNFAYG
jgi:nucleoside-diphosphate-sugar epimerase